MLNYTDFNKLLEKVRRSAHASIFGATPYDFSELKSLIPSLEDAYRDPALYQKLQAVISSYTKPFHNLDFESQFEEGDMEKLAKDMVERIMPDYTSRAEKIRDIDQIKGMIATNIFNYHSPKRKMRLEDNLGGLFTATSIPGLISSSVTAVSPAGPAIIGAIMVVNVTVYSIKLRNSIEHGKIADSCGIVMQQSARANPDYHVAADSKVVNLSNILPSRSSTATQLHTMLKLAKSIAAKHSIGCVKEGNRIILTNGDTLDFSALDDIAGNKAISKNSKALMFTRWLNDNIGNGGEAANEFFSIVKKRRGLDPVVNSRWGAAGDYAGKEYVVSSQKLLNKFFGDLRPLTVAQGDERLDDYTKEISKIIADKTKSAARKDGLHGAYTTSHVDSMIDFATRDLAGGNRELYEHVKDKIESDVIDYAQKKISKRSGWSKKLQGQGFTTMSNHLIAKRAAKKVEEFTSAVQGLYDEMMLGGLDREDEVRLRLQESTEFNDLRTAIKEQYIEKSVKEEMVKAPSSMRLAKRNTMLRRINEYYGAGVEGLDAEVEKKLELTLTQIIEGDRLLTDQGLSLEEKIKDELIHDTSNEYLMKGGASAKTKLIEALVSKYTDEGQDRHLEVLSRLTSHDEVQRYMWDEFGEECANKLSGILQLKIDLKGNNITGSSLKKLTHVCRSFFPEAPNNKAESSLDSHIDSFVESFSTSSFFRNQSKIKPDKCDAASNFAQQYIVGSVGDDSGLGKKIKDKLDDALEKVKEVRTNIPNTRIDGGVRENATRLYHEPSIQQTTTL